MPSHSRARENSPNRQTQDTYATKAACMGVDKRVTAQYSQCMACSRGDATRTLGLRRLDVLRTCREAPAPQVGARARHYVAQQLRHAGALTRRSSVARARSAQSVPRKPPRIAARGAGVGDRCMLPRAPAHFTPRPPERSLLAHLAHDCLWSRAALTASRRRAAAAARESTTRA